MKKSSHDPRSASDLDRQIGAKLRLARQLANMSQSHLGNAVGVTFQQIQKYERGTNRIAASRLHEFAVELGVPLSFFFEGVRTGPGSRSSKAVSALARLEHLKADHAQEVLEALDRCTPDVRANLVEMIRSVSKTP